MNNIFNVAVLGSTGYVGMELVKLLNNHPNININFLGSETVTNEYLTNIDGSKVYEKLPKLEKNSLFNPNESDYVFLALPIIGIQLIGAAYFQAIGKALPALLLTLSRQGLFFIPLLFILPSYFGVIGVWIAFPLADLFSTIITVYFLNRAIRKELVLKH